MAVATEEFRSATVVAIGLGAVMGIAGLAVAAVIVPALLGVAVSAIFGVEIKRGFLIGMLVVVFHIAVRVGFQLMFRL